MDRSAHSTNESLAARIANTLFGYDIFISYRRSQATDYAQALAGELAKQDFRCFLDRAELAPGDPLSSRLAEALRRSTVLILLGTSEAPDSPHVRTEVAQFAAFGRTVLPIDFGGVLGAVPPAHTLAGVLLSAIRLDESPERLALGPSTEVLAGILRAFTFRRRNARRTQILATTTLGFGLLAVGAVAATVVAVRALSLETASKQEATRSAQAERAARLDAQALANIEVEPNDAATDLLASLDLQESPLPRTEALTRSWTQRRLLRVVPGHGNVLLAIDWRPDGKYVVTGGYDRTVRVWDPESWAVVRDIPFSETISVLRFPSGPTAEGRRLAVGGESGAIAVVDVETGKSLWQRSVSDSPVREVLWDHEGGNMLVWAAGGPVHAASDETGRLFGEWKCPDAPPGKRRPSPWDPAVEWNLGYLAFRCKDDDVVESLYDRRAPPRVLPGRFTSSLALAEVSEQKPNGPAKGPSLFQADVDGAIHRTDAAGSRTTIPIATASIHQLLLRDQEMAAVDDTGVSFFHTENLGFTYPRVHVPDGVHRAAWPGEGPLLATVSGQGRGVRVYRLTKETFPKAFDDPFWPSGDLGVSMSRAGRLAIVELGQDSGSVYLGETQALSKATTFGDPAECGSISAEVHSRPAWDDDSARFAVGDASGLVHVFASTERCKEEATCPSVGSSVSAVSFDGPSILVSTETGDFTCNLDDPRPTVEPRPRPTAVSSAVASHNGCWVAGYSGDHHALIVWESRDGSILQSWDLADKGDKIFHPLVWSPNDHWVAVSGPEGRVFVVDPERAAPLRELPAGSFVFDLAWSPDERLLAVGRYDGTLLVYGMGDPKWVEPRGQFETGLRKLTAVAWSSPTELLVGGQGVGNIPFYRIGYPTLSNLRADLDAYVSWHRSMATVTPQPAPQSMASKN